jgi:hypothetical protein
VKLTDGGDFKFDATRTFDQPGETDPSGFKDPAGSLAPREEIKPPGTGEEIIVEPDGRNYRVRWWAIPA